jgi:hypothetical protein
MMLEEIVVKKFVDNESDEHKFAITSPETVLEALRALRDVLATCDRNDVFTRSKLMIVGAQINEISQQVPEQH